MYLQISDRQLNQSKQLEYKMASENFAWVTSHEIAFLNKLGTWSPNTRVRGKSKPQLVEEYMNTIFKREKWGDIDKERVEDHCLNMIVGRTS